MHLHSINDSLRRRVSLTAVSSSSSNWRCIALARNGICGRRLAWIPDSLWLTAGCSNFGWRRGVVVERRIRYREVAGSSLSRTYGVKTLGKFLTPWLVHDG